MSYSPPPVLGNVRVEPTPMIVVRKQPGVNQRWGVCAICAHFGRTTRFMLPEESAAYERHFHHCSERHMAELRATDTLAGKAPALFGPTSGDVELREWLRTHRDEVLENRKKV